MASPNFNNRTLYHLDNLDVLRGMNSESVHLIATDPPFNKGRDFHATPDSLAAGARFQDRWKWDNDVHPDWVDKIQDDWPAVWSVIESSRASWGDDMAAFLCFMGVRLMEMRRVLREDGSIYLHCDPTASHYLKALMDAIFGGKNFLSEIIWKRTSAHSDTRQGRRQHGRIHDVLLYYKKGSTWTWNPVYTEYDKEYVDKNYRDIEEGTGRRFQRDNLTAAKPGGDTLYEWRVKRPVGGRWAADLSDEWKNPKQDWEYKGVPPYRGRYWAFSQDNMRRFANEGRLVYSRTGMPRYKRYLDEMPGVSLQDMWADIKPTQGKERTGYPTQKPLSLYSRIIEASSNEGDWVLDPFAGCATTPIAAEMLGRKWVGIDIWDEAHNKVQERLEQEGLAVPESDSAQPHLLTFGDVYYSTAPPVRSDDEDESVPYLKLKSVVQEPPGPKMTRAEMFEHLVEEWGLVCRGCNRLFDDPLYLQLDHNTPRSDGGLNHISNRMLLCGPCNQIKSNTLTLSGLRRENRKRGRMAKQ